MTRLSCPSLHTESRQKPERKRNERQINEAIEFKTIKQEQPWEPSHEVY